MPFRSLDPGIIAAALRQAPGHIIITDADMVVRYLNRTEHGYEIDKIIGSNYADTLSPEQARKVRVVLQRARETGQPQEYETFVDSPTGGRQWYSTRISWFEASDGWTGMICILTEITRRKVAEERVDSLRKELVQASHRAGMAEIATGVLHNVGNVLNSVNVSAETIVAELEGSRQHLLGKAVQMLTDNEGRLPELLTQDPKGRKLPQLLQQLDRALDEERKTLQREARRLAEHLALMRSIVESQQAIAKLGDMVEPVAPSEIVEQTLSLFQHEIESGVIDLQTAVDPLDEVVLDKQATLQVLTNLVRNAIEATEATDRRRSLTLRVHGDDEKIYFDVSDNGVGIAPEHRARLFEHGFSTKRNGHGFGLHASAIAARTMNGSLEAHSDGPDQGARFRLTLPRIRK